MKITGFANIKLIVKVYALVLSIFTIFRIILYFTGLSYITENDGTGTILHAFFMGLRFDIVIAGYILFFPFLALSVIDFLKPSSKLAGKIIFYFVFSAFALAFIVCAVDIPYFGQFFSRFSVNAFQWLDTPGFVFKMIFQEIRYAVYIIPLLVVLVLFFFGLKKIFTVFMHDKTRGNFIVSIVLTLCAAGLMFVGIRGRLSEKSPIRVGTAYFCNNAFLNQLGLNPNFTLIRSALDKNKGTNQSLHLMDEALAIKKVQAYFGIQHAGECSPVLRRVIPDSVNTNPPNVVLVLMESMSAAYMQRFGNTDALTPFLDSLANAGYSFENIYSAGIHTHNGVYSTLFSFPALYAQHGMMGVEMLKYHGMASTLKQHGYQTIYFTTHDGQFDNIEGFLKANDFDEVVSQANYPADKIVSTLGVPDDYMFDFSMPFFDKLHKTGKPFFATLMTASNHGPYHVPGYFKPSKKEIKNQAIVEYSDWALRKFIALASQQSWFDNTLFVFIADHGAPLDAVYEMPLNYNHVPLIIFGPRFITQPQSFACFGGQIDVFPTIMDLLKLPYCNNTLGVDLLQEHRPFMYFAADDKYGVINDSLFLIVPKAGHEGLYKYKESDKTNYMDDYKELVTQMKEYAQANMQAAQNVIDNRKQACN